jgi:parvulin-like peptidyl-prolyl isomerase
MSRRLPALALPVVAGLSLLLAGAAAAGAADTPWLLRAGNLQVGERPLLLGLAMRNRALAGDEAKRKADEVLRRLRERLLLAAAASQAGMATDPAVQGALDEFASSHLADLYLDENVMAPARAAAKAAGKGNRKAESDQFVLGRKRLYNEVAAAAAGQIPAEVDEAALKAVVDGAADDRVVARAAGGEVRSGQLRREMARVDHPSSQEQSRERVARSVLDSILSRIRFAALADRAGYRRRPSFVEAVEDRRLRLLADRYAEVNVYAGVSATAADVEAHYQRNRERLRRGQEREIFEIVVADEQSAAAVAAKLAAGMDFGAAVKEFSQGATKDDGGRIGFVSKGEALAALDTAIAKLAAGQVSPPVKTKLGWHILRCAQVTEGRIPPLEEVRAGLEPIVLEELRAAALAAAVARLEGRIPVEFNQSRYQEILKSL